MRQSLTWTIPSLSIMWKFLIFILFTAGCHYMHKFSDTDELDKDGGLTFAPYNSTSRRVSFPAINFKKHNCTLIQYQFVFLYCVGSWRCHAFQQRTSHYKITAFCPCHLLQCNYDVSGKTGVLLQGPYMAAKSITDPSCPL